MEAPETPPIVCQSRTWVDSGAKTRCKHRVTKSQWQGWAWYDIKVTGRTAVLDYRPYVKINTKKGMELGVLRITFADEERTKVGRSEWSAADTDEFTQPLPRLRLMRERIQRVILESPLGPVAKYIHRLYRRARNSDAQNTRYDQETIQTMRRVLESDSCCIDVGAHRGSILQEMVRIASRGRHYAFEPLPHLAEYLRRRYPGVRVYEAAVSDHTGSASFLHVENAPAYSGLQERIYDRFDPVLKPITVDVVQLDEVIPSEEHVAFIKLDIEGGEFQALRGAAGIIGRCRPVIVFEAGAKSTGQYGVTPEEVYSFITDQLGYHLSTMQRWLADQSPHSLTEFSRNWYDGPDFYFIAYPVEA